MDTDGGKRKHSFRQQPNKRAKADDGSALKAGFGAKMLAKMGYKGEGGLGKEGAGISEPIQVVNRGTKGGIGIVAEKSEQQRREEKRKAEANGENPSAKEDASIIDATTGASTPTSGVSLRGADIIPFENSLQARVRRDLNSFSEAFEQLQVESQAIPPQKYALQKELEALERQMDELEDLQARIESLRTGTFEAVCEGLKSLRAAYPSKSLHRESIAVIHPHFSRKIASWEPLEDALEVVAAAFSEMADIIQPRSRRIVSQTYTHPSEALVSSNTADEEEDKIKRGTSSSYESMMLKLWLPTVSSAVTQWDVKNPQPMVHLVQVWTPVLPPFIAKRVLEQVTRKLSTSIHEWNPRKFKKSPHTWIVEWLPFLRPSDLDPKGSGLVAEIKRKIRHALQSIDLSKGPLPGMDQWRKVFGKAEFDHLLTSHLVPRFAAYLRDNFEIDPAEPDLAPLEAVFAWKGLVSNEVIGELLRSQFFPKFLEILHQWLSSEEVIFEEVGTWLAWWKNDIIKDDINNLPSVASGWNEAYFLFNQAFDLGEARMTDLPAPQVEGTEASPDTTQFSKSVKKEPPRPAPQVEEATLKDILEEFCAEENLLLIPLREAHTQTGLPLFRITASATGRGGAVAYLRGDVLWVQNKKDKSVWERTELDESLVAKAEGK
ncbi:G-patch domain protein TFIP11 [Pyrenophora tritici-repentis]|uniref:G-patch domain protein (TFIP11) n=1 Tax=Pyrenophora tritici-repentis TaxID=45151 RepID=A0A2W1GKL6_9PLEO|nr:g-patch domain-containing protein [Pyrenophora tritici-repentis]KAF7577787.1 G-patch domain protein (TFIP11) [Pyrenophora tritici-repentis]KAI0578657.1 g-patch domain-containing protein [Pyrenophora tritici-repentis]KAI0578820.1 g-patch domain-containing protein [Pyrenophora tritici-repentis]KAI0608772.1 g-patch domain-containing protein [Pyrenophora tritici-repentis]